MEYLPLGDLQKYMDKHRLIDETDVREISFQVLEGLSYMHREGFAHRDIKPDVSSLSPSLRMLSLITTCNYSECAYPVTAADE